MTKYLTRADLVERIVHMVDLEQRGEWQELSGRGFSEADETRHARMLRELRTGLMELTEDAFFLLDQMCMTGYSFDCECGRRHDIDGHTGERKTLDGSKARIENRE